MKFPSNFEFLSLQWRPSKNSVLSSSAVSEKYTVGPFTFNLRFVIENRSLYLRIEGDDNPESFDIDCSFTISNQKHSNSPHFGKISSNSSDKRIEYKFPMPVDILESMGYISDTLDLKFEIKLAPTKNPKKSQQRLDEKGVFIVNDFSKLCTRYSTRYYLEEDKQVFYFRIMLGEKLSSNDTPIEVTAEKFIPEQEYYFYFLFQNALPQKSKFIYEKIQFSSESKSKIL
ncbi:hypothetical protein TRFO_33384 [Tritrichomonas foetus]|uniref:Uncharacterized protein n=1 Tax=Tritrichomonas foetus TaxID=1144522 RepID=A0A1J4JR94_9EUKA|nr:hypothetical protein TRFO_33384 [Tritrichomonas foetus]|eukprot:OHT00036.1 hypothetical protein TRFO_33384 [Tritrichomonas foetus]